MITDLQQQIEAILEVHNQYFSDEVIKETYNKITAEDIIKTVKNYLTKIIK